MKDQDIKTEYTENGGVVLGIDDQLSDDELLSEEELEQELKNE